MKRHEVEIDTLDSLYELIEANRNHITAKFGNDERRIAWSEAKIAHVLGTLDKWVNTISVRIGEQQHAN